MWEPKKRKPLSDKGEVSVRPFDEIVAKNNVTSLEDVNPVIPFIVEVFGGIGQLAVGEYQATLATVDKPMACTLLMEGCPTPHMNGTMTGNR